MSASDQIRQMVNFILQEAHEKANEIRVKVCNLKQNNSLQRVARPMMTTMDDSGIQQGQGLLTMTCG